MLANVYFVAVKERARAECIECNQITNYAKNRLVERYTPHPYHIGIEQRTLWSTYTLWDNDHSRGCDTCRIRIRFRPSPVHASTFSHMCGTQSQYHVYIHHTPVSRKQTTRSAEQELRHNTHKTKRIFLNGYPLQLCTHKTMPNIHQTERIHKHIRNRALNIHMSLQQSAYCLTGRYN